MSQVTDYFLYSHVPEINVVKYASVCLFAVSVNKHKAVSKKKKKKRGIYSVVGYERWVAL